MRYEDEALIELNKCNIKVIYVTLAVKAAHNLLESRFKSHTLLSNILFNKFLIGIS